MDSAITKSGVLMRKFGVLGRKESRFFVLTNAGGLFYSKGIAQEYDSLKVLTSVNHRSIVTLEKSGTFGKRPTLAFRIQNQDSRGNKTGSFELEATGDDETNAWYQAMLDVLDLLKSINGDPYAARPRPLQGLKMGAEGWYLESTGRMALYKFNPAGMWSIVEKREYDEATVSYWQGSSRGRGQGGGDMSQDSAEKQVRVAMRLPGGRHVQASFSADMSLMGLLQWWAERGEIDAGVLQQGPTLQVMRPAYTAGELESTTLRSMGHDTGTAMLTLSLASPVPSSVAGSADRNFAHAGEREAAELALAIELSEAEAASSGNPSTEQGDSRITAPLADGNGPAGPPPVAPAPEPTQMNEGPDAGGGGHNVESAQ